LFIAERVESQSNSKDEFVLEVG